jgi:hypothetical protein
MRYINISNEKKRDAQVVYKAIPSPSNVHMAMESGEVVKNRRLLKGTSKNSIKTLLKQFEEPGKVAEAIILDDPDVDLELEEPFLIQPGSISMMMKKWSIKSGKTNRSSFRTAL